MTMTRRSIGLSDSSLAVTFGKIYSYRKAVRQASSLRAADTSRDVRADRFHVDRVERLAGRHEQAISSGPAEADVGADLRQQDHPDPLTRRREDVHSVVARSNPAGARPDVAVGVGADAVRHARALAVQLHRHPVL